MVLIFFLERAASITDSLSHHGLSSPKTPKLHPKMSTVKEGRSVEVPTESMVCFWFKGVPFRFLPEGLNPVHEAHQGV